jgi:hypothetical protein
MKTRILMAAVATVAVSGAPNRCQAQDDTTRHWWSDVKVRKTAQTASPDLSKPGTVSYTRPAEGPSSYATDIALSKLFHDYENKRERAAPTILGRHPVLSRQTKNTLSSKKQDTSSLA